jgi:hypothetical protein
MIQKSKGTDYSAFEALEFNPFAVPEGKYTFDFYTKLLKREALYKIPQDIFKTMQEKVPSLEDLDKMVNFVIIFCSRDSPFYTEENYERKIEICAEIVGIGAKDRLREMINKNHWWYSTLISAYMQTENNDVFMTWLSMKMAMHETQAYLRIKLDDVSDAEKHMMGKVKAVETIEKLTAKVKDYESRLFPHSRTAQAALEAATAPEERGGWAEKMARDFNPFKKK